MEEIMKTNPMILDNKSPPKELKIPPVTQHLPMHDPTRLHRRELKMMETNVGNIAPQSESDLWEDGTDEEEL